MPITGVIPFPRQISDTDLVSPPAKAFDECHAVAAVSITAGPNRNAA